MLDVTPGAAPSEPQTRTTQVRHGDRLAALIEQAAQALAVDKSTFLRAAIEREAARVLEARSRHVLTPEEAAQFSAALDASPAPTPRARDAARLYRARVAHAE